MKEIGMAMKVLKNKNTELFGLSLNTVYDYVEEAFNNGYSTFLKYAQEEFPGKEKDFYDTYYQVLQKRFKGRKMYENNTDYTPLRVISISEENKIELEDLTDYYLRKRNYKIL